MGAYLCLSVLFFTGYFLKIYLGFRLVFFSLSFVCIASSLISAPKNLVLLGFITAALLLEILSKSDVKTIVFRMGAVVCGLLVSYISGGEGGADGWMEQLMTWFQLNAASADNLLFWIRKSIHFTFYGCLAFFLWRLISDEVPRFSKKQNAIAGVAACLAFASFDELRQFVTPGRTELVSDVIIDVAGGIVFVLLGQHFHRKKTPQLKAHES